MTFPLGPAICNRGPGRQHWKAVLFLFVKTGLLPDRRRRLIMKTLIHFSRSGDSFFRPHPHHTLFSLVVTFVLAVLAVLLLAVTAK